MEMDLRRVRDWAHDKLQGGNEPPWAWYQYMKLVETLDAIIDGMAATSPTENLPQSGEHEDSGLRLVDSTYQPSKPQPRHAGLPVRLPM
jgi:hypothetical protein